MTYTNGTVLYAKIWGSLREVRGSSVRFLSTRPGQLDLTSTELNVTSFETGIDRFNLLALIQIQAYVFVILNMAILTIFRA